MDRDLNGKVSLVTGSGRNIGRAIALELAGKGSNVIINARSNLDEAAEVEAEARGLGVETLVVMGDVSEQGVVDDLKARAEERFGGVDVLVSNAAVRPHQSLFDLAVEDWTKVLNTQLTASFRLAKAFVPGMRDRGWGRIIHITGPDAFVGLADRAHNVAAKGGIRGLTKALAVELAPLGITVNDVAPGAINTVRNDLSHPRMSAGGPADMNDRSGVAAIVPMGRLGEPEEVAYACGWLASPRAGYYTGQVLCCFGGLFNVL